VEDYSCEVQRILREAGCHFVRQGKGDHEIWYSPMTRTTFPVDGKIVSRHSAMAVRDAYCTKAANLNLWYKIQFA